tara:strand:+ start:164 stop:580 length:417 start_codon:yes stop_codon:yes gene_type:complete
MSWNFNEMLDKCWATALQHEPEAKLYQGFATKEMKFVNCVFRGKNNTTLLVECNDEGESNLHAILSSYMDDCVIHPPIKMSQEESLKILTEHLVNPEWSNVVLRKPLGPEPINTSYIYTCVTGYWAVDTETGAVTKFS